MVIQHAWEIGKPPWALAALRRCVMMAKNGEVKRHTRRATGRLAGGADIGRAVANHPPWRAGEAHVDATADAKLQEPGRSTGETRNSLENRSCSLTAQWPNAKEAVSTRVSRPEHNGVAALCSTARWCLALPKAEPNLPWNCLTISCQLIPGIRGKCLVQVGYSFPFLSFRTFFP